MSLSVVEKYDGEKWHAVAAAVKPEIRLFIDGEYVDAVEGGRFETVNPATGGVVAKVAEATEADIDLAVASSLRAYRSGSWARLAPRDRMEVLYRLVGLIEKHSEELCVLDTLDMGKPITDMLTVDLPMVIETFQYFAECIDKVESAVTATENEVLHLHPAATLRSRRRHLTLELSPADGDLEGRSSVGRRELGGPQARGAGTAELPATSRALHRGRRTPGSLQRRQRHG